MSTEDMSSEINSLSNIRPVLDFISKTVHFFVFPRRICPHKQILYQIWCLYWILQARLICIINENQSHIIMSRLIKFLGYWKLAYFHVIALSVQIWGGAIFIFAFNPLFSRKREKQIKHVKKWNENFVYRNIVCVLQTSKDVITINFVCTVFIRKTIDFYFHDYLSVISSGLCCISCKQKYIVKYGRNNIYEGGFKVVLFHALCRSVRGFWRH